MFSGKNIFYTTLLCLAFFSYSSYLNAKEYTCRGPYKGQSFTQNTIQPILNTHAKWLQAGANPAIKGRANLCGTDLHGIDLSDADLRYINLAGSDLSSATLKNINLSNANLSKTFFRWSNLQGANLQNVNAQGASFENTQLQQSNFRLAKLNNTHFSHANMSASDLKSADLSNSNMSDTTLAQSDFSWANLSHANLSHANLNEVNFTETILTNSNLSDTTLKNVIFSKTNLQNVLYQPKLDNLPNLVSLATSKNFRTIRFPNTKGMAALIELRAAYKKIGLRSQERVITAMIKKQQMHQAWQNGGWGYLESIVSYVFFYLTSDFGAAPSRALLTFVLFIFLFAIPYYFALTKKLTRSGINVIWYAKTNPDPFKKVQTQVEPITLQKTLEEHIPKDFVAKCRDHLRLGRIALYFSIITAFSIGWRELNVSSWILRLQKRDYQLQGFGWVRVLAGSQSLLSAYLIVLWVLTYFGSPFEW